jgi:hypothetical protein
MTYKALKTFIGVGVKARKGSIVEVDNAEYAQKLIEGGFIEGGEDKPKTERKARAKKEV